MLQFSKNTINSWFVFTFRRRTKYKPVLIIRFSGTDDIGCFLYKLENPGTYQDIDYYMKEYDQAHKLHIHGKRGYGGPYASYNLFSINDGDMYTFDSGDNYKFLKGIDKDILYSKLTSLIKSMSMNHLTIDDLMSATITIGETHCTFDEVIDYICGSVEPDDSHYNKIMYVDLDTMNELINRDFIDSDNEGLITTSAPFRTTGLMYTINGVNVIVKLKRS